MGKAQTLHQKARGNDALAIPGDLPEMFSASDQQVTDLVAGVDQSGFGSMPYVIFATPKSERLWPLLVATNIGVQDGDPVLVQPEPMKPIRLSPFRFMLVAANQFYAVYNQDGSLMKTLGDRKPVGSAENEEYGVNVDSVIVVFAEGTAFAARCNFKTTKSQPGERASEALRMAGTPEWRKLSPDHHASLAAPKPWMRAVTEVSVIARTSRSSGRKYHQAVGRVGAAKASDWMAVDKMLRDPACKDVMEAVVENYQYRRQEVMQLDVAAVKK